jgi:hypothetical protein
MADDTIRVDKKQHSGKAPKWAGNRRLSSVANAVRNRTVTAALPDLEGPLRTWSSGRRPKFPWRCIRHFTARTDSTVIMYGAGKDLALSSQLLDV